MRAKFAVSMLALLAAAGCASRNDLRALQAPAPLPHGMIRFDSAEQYRDAVALEWIGGMSQRSYIFAEPNQRMFRPILEDALEDAGLRAQSNVRARYGLRVDVSDADGPSIGADYNSEFVATYVVVDREQGREVWRREIRTPGAGRFLALNEADWQRFWSYNPLDPIAVVYDVANPMNFFPFASDGAADNARRQGMHGDRVRAQVERNGAQRAARANYAAGATNVSQFLLAFATDNNVDVIPILPCWGSPEVEALKFEILSAGRAFATDDCNAPR
jgi:hypothetical protein